MKLYLLKHKGYKARPLNFVEVITQLAAGDDYEIKGVVAYFTLKGAKKRVLEFEKRYGIEYEIVKFNLEEEKQ
ncbi:MAG: hypothetical protein DRP08_03935 [Candidatus Aenigmatarchaeota archaeon]|nr:MAG: hypothetical protein DRP08_03935 [Candidatus Aenigmarchaeota archaeon]